MKRVWRHLGAAFALAGAIAFPSLAQEDLKIDTPSINALKKSLADRHVMLKPRFEDGAVGILFDGNLGLHDGAKLSAEARDELERMIVDDNKDRQTLYREIARANGRSDGEDSIRTAFADRWRERAPSGWWLQARDGTWAKKP